MSIVAVVVGGAIAIFTLLFLLGRETDPKAESHNGIQVIAGQSGVGPVMPSARDFTPLVADARVSLRDQRAREMEASFKRDYAFIDTVQVACNGEKCAIKGQLKSLSTAEAYDDFTGLIDNDIKSKMATHGFVATDNVVIDTTGDAFIGFHADLVVR